MTICDREYLKRSLARTQRVVFGMLDPLVVATSVLRRAIEDRATIFSIGNGGSASMAAHFSTELLLVASPPIRSICLSADVNALTTAANDYGFESIFECQLMALANRGDVLVAFSGSGNSRNVLLAVEYAKENGVQTIGITGPDGDLARQVEIAVTAHGSCQETIENGMFIAQHAIAYALIDAQEEKE